MTGYEVVLLRHGETHGYDGDHGLTDRGERQARERGAALAAELKPGATVRMPHARTARGTATAVTLRAALLDALGPDHTVDVGALYPEPWFDNLRFALNGECVDASVAVTERLGLEGHLPDWAREFDRFDTDFGATSRAGGPIEYWVRRPTLWFEPPHLAAHRTWRGVVEVGRDAPEGLVVLVSTHSAPMRAFAATAIGDDPGEPENLEEIRVSVRADGSATVRFREHTVEFDGAPDLPPWVDRAWYESYGR